MAPEKLVGKSVEPTITGSNRLVQIPPYNERAKIFNLILASWLNILN